MSKRGLSGLAKRSYGDYGTYPGSSFAFAKRASDYGSYPGYGGMQGFAFAKRSANVEEDSADQPQEEKRFAFAKRSMRGFAKRASFAKRSGMSAFAKRGGVRGFAKRFAFA